MASTPIDLIADAPPRRMPGRTSGFRFGRYAGAGPSRRRKIACYLALALFTGFCGLAYGATYGNPFFLIAPLALLSVTALWAMPDVRHPPVRLLRSAMTVMLFLYLCWPDYIALVIGDLPWISAVRLTCVPLAVVLLLCAFGSHGFRMQMVDIVRGDRLIVGMFAAFIAYAALSVAFSSEAGFSFDKFLVLSYSAVVPFFAAIYLFNTPGRVRIFAYYLFVIAAYNIVIGLIESAHSALPWAKSIPGFLTIEDEQINARLTGMMRNASNQYRVGSRFSTSIGLGEYLGLALPFMLHLFFNEKSIWAKLLVAALIPPLFYVVIKTDSRLGFICFLSAILLYVFYQAAVIWRNRPANIFAPAILMAYPAMIALFVALTFFWHSLHIRVFGGGAAQFSTQARQEQWSKGIPMILSRPWGHGLGTAADTLQYYSIGTDFLTIDSYYLSILLEFGIPVFFLFYGMFVWASGRSMLAAVKTRDADVAYLAAVGIALANFVVGKSVYSQQENHTLAFILLGIAVALLRRHAAETGRLPPPPSENALYAPIGGYSGKDWKRGATGKP